MFNVNVFEAFGLGHEHLLKFKASLRIGRKGDLTDFCC